MTASSAFRVAALVFAAALTIQATNASACTRRPKHEHSPEDSTTLYHGPGTYGELDRTVTLDCLRYVGSVERDGREHVLIQDERGKIHTLKIGSAMGWNRSFIIKIDSDFIYLKQLVNLNEPPYTVGRDLTNATKEEIEKYNEPRYKEMTVKFPKQPKPQ